jgi:hypothetical protein
MVAGGPGQFVGLASRGVVLVLASPPSLVGHGSAPIVDSRFGTGWTGGQYLGLLLSMASRGLGPVQVQKEW